MGFQGLKGLLVLSLALARAAGAVGAQNFLIKVLMNYCTRSLFGGVIGAEARTGSELETGSRPEGARLKAGYQRATLL